MTKYSDIEIQTAKILLKKGYKWIAMDESGGLFAYTDKPIKLDTFWWSDVMCNCVCYYVPIFRNIRFDDKEPTSLEGIVHPQILDDAERKYLSAVIRPFRDKVEYIEKVDSDCEEYIHIRLNLDWAILPHFKKGTMYKNMETNRCYKLEELGL